jgi:tRNA (mo5U34)-methyltransferase
VDKPPPRDAETAKRFLADAGFVWFQRFALADGIYTPGMNDLEWVFSTAGIPSDLSGKTALDIGTSNGGAAFELERRGAERVVAVDIFPPWWFGFDALKEFLGSRVEFVEGTVYELPALLNETFDIVVFWGVLYHLRHPLLALDSLRALLRGACYLETAVCDGELGTVSSVPLARFYRGAELHGDPSNWFSPTIKGLLDWCSSAGLDADVVAAWPEEAPERCILKVELSPGDPEYRILSYERPLRCAPTVPLFPDGS